jgi:hypothetical protein
MNDYAFPLHIDWHCLCGDALTSHSTKADGERCVGHCQGTPLDCRGFGYRPIDHSGRTPAISAIFEMAGRLQMPKHYTCDLSTDYKALTVPDAPDRFLWVVRESGTHLYPLQQVLAFNESWTAGYIMASLTYHEQNHDGAQCFHWNGYTLDPVNWDTAKTLAVLPIPLDRAV